MVQTRESASRAAGPQELRDILYQQETHTSKFPRPLMFPGTCSLGSEFTQTSNPHCSPAPGALCLWTLCSPDRPLLGGQRLSGGPHSAGGVWGPMWEGILSGFERPELA